MNLITAQPGIIATIYLSPIALLKIIKTPLRVRALTAQTDRQTHAFIGLSTEFSTGPKCQAFRQLIGYVPLTVLQIKPHFCGSSASPALSL